MRIINVSFFFLIIFCFSCNSEGKKNNNQRAARNIMSYSQTAEDGNEDRNIEGDELFDDFFYNFMTDNSFQKNRVIFPITEIINGEKIVLDKNNWNYDKTFEKLESYVSMFKDSSQVDISKDIDLKTVNVEWINISEQLIKQYFFEKTNSKWHLTTIHVYPMKNNENMNFWTFYEKFASDSIFQRRCLKTPISFETYDAQDGEVISGFLDVEQWFSFAPVLPSGIIVNVNYGTPFIIEDECFFVIRELSNSMASHLKFCKIDDFWMLTKLEN